MERVKMKDLITVITLAYYSLHLKETIDSVLMQTYPRIQYLIFDDASSSFSLQEIENYIEKKKRTNIEEYVVYQNKTNLGTVKSYYSALQYVKGNYIFHLAGDDIFYDALVLEEWVCEFLKRGSGIITAYRAVYDKEMKQYQGLLPTKEQVEILLQKDARQLFEELTKGNFIFGCCTARSRENIKKYGICSKKYQLVDDYPTYLSLTRKGENIEFWDRIVIQYRSGGMSSPINFNQQYEKDSDLIFRNEIIKYTKYPLKRWFSYQKWKYWHKGEGRILFYQKKYQKNRIKQLLISIRYPIHALRVYRKKRRKKNN